MTAPQQLELQLYKSSMIDKKMTTREKLVALLSQDLDFHGQDSSYATHNFHAFPAKFPPQLPRKFISALTNPGDIVLDPMNGSGTTVLEAFIAHRRAIGFDIDPLAILTANVKVTPVSTITLGEVSHKIVSNARTALQKSRGDLQKQLDTRWDKRSQKFIKYWFSEGVQIELMALLQEIERLEDKVIKCFFQLAFSAIIITKSGGVSLALDLAHTRPHRAKLVHTQSGDLLFGKNWVDSNDARLRYVSKTLRSPVEEFEKRVLKNLKSIRNFEPGYAHARIQYGDAQNIPLKHNSVDLIVTSPPYASNAIDYMRAHKFSLVWFGYPIDDLSQTRRQYIGGEATNQFKFEKLPAHTAKIVSEISNLDSKKGQVLHRYYSEMTRTFKEMHRVLKPGHAAIVVVGSSVMRGQDTETAECLAEIGESIGFDAPMIGVRMLDRNRRMMPAGHQVDHQSQIQHRMHEEYVIGLLKPGS